MHPSSKMLKLQPGMGGRNARKNLSQTMIIQQHLADEPAIVMSICEHCQDETSAKLSIWRVSEERGTFESACRRKINVSLISR